jgi:hypothetical protein
MPKEKVERHRCTPGAERRRNHLAVLRQLCDPKRRKVPASHCFCLPNARIDAESNELFGPFVLVPDPYSPSPTPALVAVETSTHEAKCSRRSTETPFLLLEMLFTAACGIPRSASFSRRRTGFRRKNPLASLHGTSKNKLQHEVSVRLSLRLSRNKNAGLDVLLHPRMQQYVGSVVRCRPWPAHSLARSEAQNGPQGASGRTWSHYPTIWRSRASPAF